MGGGREGSRCAMSGHSPFSRAKRLAIVYAARSPRVSQLYRIALASPEITAAHKEPGVRPGFSRIETSRINPLAFDQYLATTGAGGTQLK